MYSFERVLLVASLGVNFVLISRETQVFVPTPETPTSPTAEARKLVDIKPDEEAGKQTDSQMATGPPQSSSCSSCSRRLDRSEMQLFPLLKELGCAWTPDQTPPYVQKKVTTPRKNSLIVDIGLNAGIEFFAALNNGFEVVGFEPNPHSYSKLKARCHQLPACHGIDDVDNASFPLNRLPSHSYVINAAVGANRTTMELFFPPQGSTGAVGTLNQPPRGKSYESHKVPVVRLDDIIRSDVYMLKIDAQGHDYYILQGAQKLFQEFTVRQVTFEIDPSLTTNAGVDFWDLMELVYNDYGLQCFTTQDTQIPVHRDTAEQFYQLYMKQLFDNPVVDRWHSRFYEDFLCLNMRKPYRGPALPLTKKSAFPSQWKVEGEP